MSEHETVMQMLTDIRDRIACIERELALRNPGVMGEKPMTRDDPPWEGLTKKDGFPHVADPHRKYPMVSGRLEEFSSMTDQEIIRKAKRGVMAVEEQNAIQRRA